MSRMFGRTMVNTHLYGALFAGTVLSYCVRKLTGGHLGPLTDFLAIVGNGTCGLSWLLARALFQRPETARRLWPFALVLAIVAGGAVLRFCGDRQELVPRMIGNVEALVSSTVLLLAAIEPLITNFRDMTKAEQRFRLIFAICYTADLTFGYFLIDGAPKDSLVVLWKDQIRVVCALASVVGMLFAVRYRDRNPLPEPLKAKRGPPSAAESELGEQLLRLIKNEVAYSLHELKLADLASRLGEAEYKVTQCITGALGFRNFNQMINHFRIAEAKRRLADPAFDHLPVLTIALDCGFGSIGPFNRAFKAEMAVTPTEFRRSSKTAGV